MKLFVALSQAPESIPEHHKCLCLLNPLPGLHGSPEGSQMLFFIPMFALWAWGTTSYTFQGIHTSAR